MTDVTQRVAQTAQSHLPLAAELQTLATDVGETQPARVAVATRKIESYLHNLRQADQVRSDRVLTIMYR